MTQPIHIDLFYSEGRGPQLINLHWKFRGCVLEAAEFMLPNASSEEDLKYVQILRSQVVMRTPEEVIDYRKLGHFTKNRPAAMFNLGKSDWLKSFSQHHLQKCNHYQFLFYDELLDIIAEGVEFGKGRFNQLHS